MLLFYSFTPCIITIFVPIFIQLIIKKICYFNPCNDFCSRIWFSCAYEYCNARGFYLNGQLVTTVRHGDHDPDPRILINRKSNFELRSRCLKTLEQRKVIYHDVSTKAEYRGIFEGQNTDAIHARMRTWRHAAQYPNFNEIGGHGRPFERLMDSLFSLEFENLRQCQGDLIGLELRHTATHGDIVIIYDERLLNNLADSRILYIVPTHMLNSLDLPIDEWLLVLAVQDDKIIPCMWAMVQIKSPESYDLVVDFVGEKFPVVNKIYNNWDTELIDACEQHFPDADIQGTWYNWGKILRSRAVQLLDIDVSNQLYSPTFKKLLILPLLPNPIIPRALEQLVASLPRVEAEMFQPLIDYIRQTWLVDIGNARLSFINPDKLQSAARIGTVQRSYESFIDQKINNRGSWIQCFGKFHSYVY